jgi:hypothetical protein
MQYLKLDKKFKKQAYRELLELCNEKLGKNEKTYQGFFTINGTLLEILDEITEEDRFLLVSDTPSKGFKGLYNNHETLGHKELRFENAVEVRKKINNINKEWANQQYIKWLNNVQGKFCIENIEISLRKHQGNEYDLNNTFYRKNFKNKLG